MLKWCWRVGVRGWIGILGVVATASAESRVVLYSVRPGDSLGRIARRHDVTIEAICRANVRTRNKHSSLRSFDHSSRKRRLKSRTRGTDGEPSQCRGTASGAKSVNLPSAIWQRHARQPRSRVATSLSRATVGVTAGPVAASGGVVSSDTRAAFSRVRFDHHTGQEKELAGGWCNY